jgi:type II secretory pathway pseudopilin PulG
MMSGIGVLVVVLVLGLLAPLVLYAIVRAERDGRESMDRADAERVARRDTNDRDSR